MRRIKIDGFQSAQDLFGRVRLFKANRPLSERASLIAYLVKQVKRPAKVVGIRLAHYTLDDLYALISMHEDRLRRDGRETADKFWWWTTRTQIAA